MDKNHKIYFASDLHLGLPDYKSSLVREKHFVKWLDMIKKDASEIYLVGDVFDFWYEYKKVVPRGFTRLLGKLSEITDSGIPIHYFTGNHDVWVYDYLPMETGVIVHRQPFVIERNNKRIYIAHGDGLGPGDKSFKLLKKIFTSGFLQWCFSRLHPNFSLWFGQNWSLSRRYSHGKVPEYYGDDKEWLVLYSKDRLTEQHYDYFIYGHRHLPLEIQITENSKFVNLGDWISNFTYAVFDGEELNLKRFPIKE